MTRNRSRLHAVHHPNSGEHRAAPFGPSVNSPVYARDWAAAVMELLGEALGLQKLWQAKDVEETKCRGTITRDGPIVRLPFDAYLSRSERRQLLNRPPVQS